MERAAGYVYGMHDIEMPGCILSTSTCEMLSNFVFAMYLQLHSSEVGDGYEWGRLNLQSVTEESRLDEFLSTAQLAGTEFTAGVCASDNFGRGIIRYEIMTIFFPMQRN